MLPPGGPDADTSPPFGRSNFNSFGSLDAPASLNTPQGRAPSVWAR